MNEQFIRLYVWTRDMDVSLEERLIYSFILSKAEENYGYCIYSANHIAATLGFKIIQCKNAISHLSEIGAIKIEDERRIVINQDYTNCILGASNAKPTSIPVAPPINKIQKPQRRPPKVGSALSMDAIMSEHNNSERDNAASEFIRRYLQPKVKFEKSDKQQFIERFIVNGEQFPVDVVAKHIKEMEYKDFLYTPYWRSIAMHIKDRSGRICSVCGADKTNVEAHHTTYKHHGDELHHLDDIICVCKSCHEKLHNERF